MRKNNLVSRFLFGFFILLLMTGFTNPGFAQDKEADQQLYKFSYIQVKPGMDVEFEEFLKNIIPTLQKIGLTQMDIFKTSNFGMSNKYLVVTPLEDPSVADAELSAPKSNVPVGLVSAMSAIQRMVVSIHDFMLIPQPDLNIPLAEGYDIKLFANITFDTAPGRGKDFKKGFKKVVNAIGKTNIKGILVGKVGIGGNLDQYIVSVFYDSFKEIATNQAAIQKELAAADLTFLNGVVYSRESEILVRVPELCIQPATQ